MSIQDDVDIYILGNGFDLAVGLPSNYSDFFKNRFRHAVSSKKETLTAVSKMPTCNAWDLIFANYIEVDSFWCNIEQIIANMAANNNPFMMGLTMSCILGLQKKTPKEVRKLYASLIRYFDSHYIDSMFKLKSLASQKYCLKHEEIGIKIVYSILLDELNKEENIFMDYLDKAVASIDYETLAEKLFQSIRDAHSEDRKQVCMGTADLPGISITPKQIILSFNYTRFGCWYNDDVFANINGSLKDRNAIFGTSDSANSNWDFSKTSRSAMQSDPPTYREEAMSAINASDKVNSINIFGHSLQEPDDPYFFDIFNKARISTDNVPIRFYYTETAGRPFNKRKLINSARLLFERYDDKNGLDRFSSLMRSELLTFNRLDLTL
ncbi:AbiH family protein [Bifidobacterium avesanii]|nr:AbiH family protein [Bifidobacterium avesanii]KAB8293647.1 Bacteriophage abortive infection AbiH [Bifidobacterium avesanii]